MADDRLALEISYLRIAADGIRISPEAMDMDGVSARFGRAADALEAVLKLAGEQEADAAELDRDIAGARKSHYASDHAQAITDEALAKELRQSAEALREAITRALTGEGGNG